MAITKVGAMTDPPVAGDYTILQAKLDAYAKQIGNQGMILTQWTNTTTAPKIAMGSYITHGGTLFVVDTEDFAVTEPAGDGTYYLKVSVSGDTLALAWIASLSGYTWNAIYNGLYHSDESQILPYQLVKVGATLTKRKITNLLQGSGFVTVDWTGAIVGQAISGTSLSVSGEILDKNGNEVLSMNMETVTENGNFTSSTINPIRDIDLTFAKNVKGLVFIAINFGFVTVGAPAPSELTFTGMLLDIAIVAEVLTVSAYFPSSSSPRDYYYKIICTCATD